MNFELQRHRTRVNQSVAVSSGLFVSEKLCGVGKCNRSRAALLFKMEQSSAEDLREECEVFDDSFTIESPRSSPRGLMHSTPIKSSSDKPVPDRGIFLSSDSEPEIEAFDSSVDTAGKCVFLF